MIMSSLYFEFMITIRHADWAAKAGMQPEFQKETNIRTYLVLKRQLIYFLHHTLGQLLQIQMVHSNIVYLFHSSFEHEVQTIFPMTPVVFQIRRVWVFGRNSQKRTFYKCIRDRCIRSIGWLQMQIRHLDQSLFVGIFQVATKNTKNINQFKSSEVEK